MGKSSLIETLARQDVVSRPGIALIDPHGDLFERMKNWAVPHANTHVVVVDLPEPTSSITFNPLEQVSTQRRPLAAAGLVEALKKIFSDSWGVRLEYLLRNALLLLLDQPAATLSDVLRLFRDVNFRSTSADFGSLSTRATRHGFKRKQ